MNAQDWLRFVYQRGYRSADPERAAALLDENPDFAHEYPLAVGNFSALSSAAPPFGMPPLIAVTFSSLIRLDRFAPALRTCALQLLEAGADPNQTWTDEDFPQYALSALYGAAGLNHDPEMTRLLLERGANPNDGESLYHSLEAPDLDCTRLLLQYGADPKRANAVAKVLDYDNLEGLRLLLPHCSGMPLDRELAHALRRRRSPAHIRELLNAGAKTEGAWRLAMLNGLPEIAAMLPAEPLSEPESFVAACARADRAAAERILSANPGILASLSEELLRRLPDLAEARDTEAVRLMVELGWPLETRGGDWRATALNHAVFQGDADLTRFLLRHGADWRTPHGFNDNAMGTLCYAARNRVPGSLECARALVEAGMPKPGDEYEFPPAVENYFNSVFP